MLASESFLRRFDQAIIEFIVTQRQRLWVKIDGYAVPPATSYRFRGP